jgi:hypothetical protein
MAEPLKQLDLFGMETSAPVHIAAPKQAKALNRRNPYHNTESQLTKKKHSRNKLLLNKYKNLLP